MASELFTSVNLLAVEISAPPTMFGFPAGNMIGTPMLTALIQAHLNAAGLDTPGFGAGEFNSSFYIFTALDFPAALRVVQEALRAAHLKEFARIYRYDGGELVLRCIWPERGNVVPLASFMARVSASCETTRKFLDEKTPVLDQLKKTAKSPSPYPSQS